ncbi:hypothetical protein [Hafnia alvei]|uniref:hypothetical protein n=1 Tax=Hafnia alvei TaxID=569 RepID=UPI001456024D|nr:hypothetical protein [Hafnia alvei]NLS55961.1 hypothetical protein [Hafnia alvei]
MNPEWNTSTRTKRFYGSRAIRAVIIGAVGVGVKVKREEKDIRAANQKNSGGAANRAK